MNLEGITPDTCPESMGSALTPPSGKHILPTETSPGENKEGMSSTEAQQSFTSPSGPCASNLNLPFGLHGFEKEQSHLKKRR